MKYFIKLISLVGLMAISQLAYSGSITDNYTKGDVLTAGTLNNIKSPTMTGHAIRHAVERAAIDGAEVDDVIIGAVLTAGTAGMNIGRLASLAA